jgi:acetyl-CoA carboxylase biotin carboxyl carrier protein
MAKKQKPEASAGAPVRGVDLAEVERLLDFMQKHSLDQFEYERDGVHILLKKASAQAPGQLQGSLISETPVSPLPVPPVAVPDSTPPPQTSEGAAGPAANLHVIKSPIVGTYYAAPSPGADPFVTVGAHVEPGQVMCIIEAMKLMNEIESDVAGTVVRILSENGNPVEYGEPLFEVRPDSKKK